jgi:hypothetical protein
MLGVEQSRTRLGEVEHAAAADSRNPRGRVRASEVE